MWLEEDWDGMGGIVGRHLNDEGWSCPCLPE